MSKNKSGKKDSEEKIKMLEKRISVLEKEQEEEKEEEKEQEKEPSIVEGVVSQFIPGLGDIVRNLEKTSPEFRKRIAETDAKIKHRLETGWSSKPEVEFRSFARPLVPEGEEFRPERTIKKEEIKELNVEAQERELTVDVFEEDDYISVIAELPGIDEKDIKAELENNILRIACGKYSKELKLPSVPESIVEKTYKNGILELKLQKQKR